MHKGFTLIEVLISVAIVGLALVGMLEMFTVASKGGKISENLSIATNLAQERMEEIKNLVQNGVKISIGTGSNTGDDFLPDLESVSTDSYLDGNLYLTESDSYFFTSTSLSAMIPVRRVDRITQIEWIDDPETSETEDYKKIQVTVFYQEKGKTTSTGLVTYVRE